MRPARLIQRVHRPFSFRHVHMTVVPFPARSLAAPSEGVRSPFNRNTEQ
jgi:hypothetical protein